MTISTFPARFEFLDEIREFVGETARRGGFSDKEIYSLQLAADEAASNIIEHAYGGDPGGSIEITCEVQGNRFSIVLRDHGRTFDPAKVKPPNIKAELSKRQVGGLGMYLMRKIMDEVRYESHGGTNVLTMVKRRG